MDDPNSTVAWLTGKNRLNSLATLYPKGIMLTSKLPLIDPPELITEANALKLNSEMDCRSSIGLLGFSILSAN